MQVSLHGCMVLCLLSSVAPQPLTFSIPCLTNAITVHVSYSPPHPTLAFHVFFDHIQLSIATINNIGCIISSMYIYFWIRILRYLIVFIYHTSWYHCSCYRLQTRYSYSISTIVVRSPCRAGRILPRAEDDRSFTCETRKTSSWCFFFIYLFLEICHSYSSRSCHAHDDIYISRSL